MLYIWERLCELAGIGCMGIRDVDSIFGIFFLGSRWGLMVQILRVLGKIGLGISLFSYAAFLLSIFFDIRKKFCVNIIS